mgnify:CR=1 FL=1
MKRYKLDGLKVGMRVLLSDTEDVETPEGFTRTTGVISKISDRKLQVKHLKESLYFRRKGYSKFFE